MCCITEQVNNLCLQFYNQGWHEAEHNALLGIVQTLLHHPERYPEPPYLALVQNNIRILAIAMRTPPNNLLLSKVQDLQALPLIAQDLQQIQLPGVSGLVAETAAFVQTWHALAGQPCHRELESRIYHYPNAMFGSWGDYALLRRYRKGRNQFKQDSKFHSVPFPIAYPHVNLKQLFSEVQGLPKRYGMAEALQLAEIELEGTHHRGIDDARNIAKLLSFILGRQQLNQPSTA